MSIIGDPSKSRIRLPNNSAQDINTANVADLNNKVQNTYLISATVEELRPGGVILDTVNVATVNGKVRASNTLPLLVGDRVMARITYTGDGEVKAYIVEKLEQQANTNESQARLSFAQYISSIFTNKNYRIPILPATFNYLDPNRNILRFGYINPGDPVGIQILDDYTGAEHDNIISGSIISNDHDQNVISVNSSIGIININARSSLREGQRILFKITETTTEDQISSIADSIALLMQNITDNLNVLKQILAAYRDIHTRYPELLRLTAPIVDNLTLAKIFHQSRNVPATEIDEWIKQDIVEPLASGKGSKFSILSQKITQIYDNLKNIGIIPNEVWREVPIYIANTNQYANLKIKRTENDILNFTLTINHPEFGEITLEGIIELKRKNKYISNLLLNIKHTNQFPQEMADALKAIFIDHIATSNINGSVNFVTTDS